MLNHDVRILLGLLEEYEFGPGHRHEDAEEEKGTRQHFYLLRLQRKTPILTDDMVRDLYPEIKNADSFSIDLFIHGRYYPGNQKTF
jgi:hypothetical protein